MCTNISLFEIYLRIFFFSGLSNFLEFDFYNTNYI